MGWLEKKLTSGHRDIRLVRKEGNEFIWLDGKKEDSEINFTKAIHSYLNFAFVKDKIYALFRQGYFKSKVYKNQKWIPISEKVERTGYWISTQENDLHFLVVEEVPVFVFHGMSENCCDTKVFVSGLFDELD